MLPIVLISSLFLLDNCSLQSISADITDEEKNELTELLYSVDTLISNITNEKDFRLSFYSIVSELPSYTEESNIVAKVHDLIIRFQDKSIFQEIWRFNWYLDVESGYYTYFLDLNIDTGKIWEYYLKRLSTSGIESLNKIGSEIAESRSVQYSTDSIIENFDRFDMKSEIDRMFMSLYILSLISDLY